MLDGVSPHPTNVYPNLVGALFPDVKTVFISMPSSTSFFVIAESVPPLASNISS